MTAEQRVRAAHRVYTECSAAMQVAAAECAAAVDAFRAENPAPAGKYWVERNGEMRLRDLPEHCEHWGDDECAEPAVKWSVDGAARCKEHEDEI